MPPSLLTGRLSLSEVQLTSARPGPGVQAGWVEECTCPPGYAGPFCQSCAPGFKREIPFGSPFVSCVPCACNQHGDCHPLTGTHPTDPPTCPATACTGDKSVPWLVCEGCWKPSVRLRYPKLASWIAWLVTGTGFITTEIINEVQNQW